MLKSAILFLDRGSQLDEEIVQQEEQAENINKFIGKVQKNLDLDELTVTVLNDMVKTVMFSHLTRQKDIGNRRLTFPMTLWEYFLPLC